MTSTLLNVEQEMHCRFTMMYEFLFYYFHFLRHFLEQKICLVHWEKLKKYIGNSEKR